MLEQLNDHDLSLVAGGDAAATREPGTNSWGERPGDSAAKPVVDRVAQCILDGNAGGYGGIVLLVYCNLRDRYK